MTIFILGKVVKVQFQKGKILWPSTSDHPLITVKKQVLH